jgi:hypothetical protein
MHTALAKRVHSFVARWTHFNLHPPVVLGFYVTQVHWVARAHLLRLVLIAGHDGNVLGQEFLEALVRRQA